MNTITIRLPSHQARCLRKVDMSDLIQRFIEDYVEHEEDQALRRKISKSAKIARLTEQLAKAL